MTGSQQYDPAPSASSTSASSTTASSTTASSATASSTTDVAKDQASQVAGGAADAAQHVAGVAKEQVGQVAAVAGQQVKQLAGQAQSELSNQAAAQQTKLAGGLHFVGDQLKSMAEKSEQTGVATDLAHQAAEKVHQVAGWLEDRTPADLLAELRSFGRRRPGSFLVAALAAGVVAGRMARGMTADPAAAGSPTQTAQQRSAVLPPAVGGGPAPLTLPAGGPAAEPDPYGAAPVRDWTTPRSGEIGDWR